MIAEIGGDGESDDVVTLVTLPPRFPTAITDSSRLLPTGW